MIMKRIQKIGDIIKRLKENGLSVKKISKVLNVDRSTVWRWFHNKHTNSKRKGKTKCDEGVEQWVCKNMVASSTLRQRNVKSALEDLYQTSLSQPTISGILKKHNISHKKLTLVSDRQIGKEEFVQAFLQNTRGINPALWIAMDESGFKLGDRTRSGYAFKGERARATKKISVQNYSLLLCPSFDGRCVWRLIKRAANSIIFQDFQKNDIGRAFPNAHLILDNIPFHKATNSLTRHGLPTVQQTTNSLGIHLHYTAPYCSFLNPAENYFSIIKSFFVRRAIPNTEEGLRLSTAEAVESIGQAKS